MKFGALTIRFNDRTVRVYDGNFETETWETLIKVKLKDIGVVYLFPYSAVKSIKFDGVTDWGEE